MPDNAPVKVAVLDDYQGVAAKMADWRRLDGRAEVTFFRDHLAEPDSVVRRLKPFDVVCVMRERTPLPAATLGQLPNLKLVVTTGRRNPSIDMAAAAEGGILVCNTGGKAHGAAELTWALIMAMVRRLPVELAAVRDGRWQETVGGDLAGKTIGVVGLGSLGARIARIAQVFEMTVLAWSPNLTADKAAQHGARLASKDDLFRLADIVTLHLVLGPRSKGIVGAAELALMKPTAYLVNTSRGPLVDEAALIDALRRRVIAGAALDVYDVEPLPEGHAFRRLDNVLATPHVGFVTEETYRVFYREMVEDIVAWLDGVPLRVVTAEPQ
jgi:phosphoglycerate dehydrogenase-like enzyme